MSRRIGIPVRGADASGWPAQRLQRRPQTVAQLGHGRPYNSMGTYPPDETSQEFGQESDSKVVHLPQRLSRRRTRRKAAASGRIAGKVRTNLSAKEKARVAWQPTMSVQALQNAAGISRPTAQKYHAKFSAEKLAQSPVVEDNQAAQ